MGAERVRVIVTDVDGVLTDGRLSVDDAGIETKTFHVWDGSAAAHLRQMGIGLAIITGRQSRAMVYRAREMGVTELHQGHRDKLAVLQRLATTFAVTLDEMAFIGDDLLDIRALAAVGFACAPADARPEVRAFAHYVTAAPGGRGVLREVAEIVLRARGLWEPLMAHYLPTTEADPAADSPN